MLDLQALIKQIIYIINYIIKYIFLKHTRLSVFH